MVPLIKLTFDWFIKGTGWYFRVIESKWCHLKMLAMYSEFSANRWYVETSHFFMSQLFVSLGPIFNITLWAGCAYGLGSVESLKLLSHGSENIIIWLKIPVLVITNMAGDVLTPNKNVFPLPNISSCRHWLLRPLACNSTTIPLHIPPTKLRSWPWNVYDMTRFVEMQTRYVTYDMYINGQSLQLGWTVDSRDVRQIQALMMRMMMMMMWISDHTDVGYLQWL